MNQSGVLVVATCQNRVETPDLKIYAHLEQPTETKRSEVGSINYISLEHTKACKCQNVANNSTVSSINIITFIYVDFFFPSCKQEYAVQIYFVTSVCSALNEAENIKKCL